MTALDGVKERLAVELAEPGTHAKIELVRDIQYLLAVLEDVQDELELIKSLVNWQSGAEFDTTVM